MDQIIMKQEIRSNTNILYLKKLTKILPLSKQEKKQAQLFQQIQEILHNLLNQID